MVFSLTGGSSLTGSASDTLTVFYGGETITAGGTYYLAEETTAGSVITIATTENVTIVGNGAEFDEDGVMIDSPQANLVFDASGTPGAHLTLKDVYLSNSSGANLINFKGKGNVLTILGTCVLDHDVNAMAYASIHVGVGTALTINGDGTLYFYKRSQGAGIGGDTEEMNGDITFDMDGGYAFIKGSKQGAVIGAGSNASSATDAPGTVTFLSGTYNLIGNARGAVIGGSAGSADSGGGSTGTTVYIKGGLININTDFSGASVGGGGYAEGNDASGGTMYVTGGSLRVYIDTNAASYATTGWQGRSFTVGVNDASITAQRLNEDGEEVYWLWFDTQQVSPDENGEYTVYIDDSDTPFYSGSLYEYYFIQEALDKEAGEQYAITSTPQNWAKMSGETQDSNLYLWVPTGMESQDDGTRTGTPAQHKVTVNGEIFIYQWNEEEYAFELLHAGDHEYVAGKCSACGGVLDDYTWYYDNEDGNTFTVSSAAELAALADIVNSGADDFSGDTITLGGDVDLSQDTAFAGIGNSTTPFAGTFDGGGRTVTLGMESDAAATLFAVVNGAVLENITTDGSVTGTSSDGTAGLAAVVGGDGVRMTDCVNEADISGAENTGGLIGASDSVSVITVSGCTNSGIVTGTGDCAGGGESSDRFMPEVSAIPSIWKTER